MIRQKAVVVGLLLAFGMVAALSLLFAQSSSVAPTRVVQATPAVGMLAAVSRSMEDVCDELRFVESVPAALERNADKLIDPEWLSFPRKHWSVVAYCKSAPTGLKAQALFRNPELNPRDSYFPPEVRRVLSDLLAAIGPKLVAFHDARMAVYSREFSWALEEGLVAEVPARPVRREKLVGTITTQVDSISLRQLQAAGADMGTMRDGKVMGIGRQALPASRAALEQERFVGMELATMLVAWFQTQGALSAQEADVLREKVFR